MARLPRMTTCIARLSVHRAESTHRVRDFPELPCDIFFHRDTCTGKLRLGFQTWNGSPTYTRAQWSFPRDPTFGGARVEEAAVHPLVRDHRVLLAHSAMGRSMYDYEWVGSWPLYM